MTALEFSLNEMENKNTMKFISLIIFILIQTPFLPFSIIGYIIFEYKNRLVSKKLGVSATAVSALAGKYMSALAGTHQNNLAGKLYTVLPNASVAGF